MPTSAELPLSSLPSVANQIVRDVVKGDYSPAMLRVAVAAKADIKERFVTATRPDGPSR